MNNITKAISKCNLCRLSQLKENITTESNPHFGKLYPKFHKEKCMFFIVGLNPSRVRYQGSDLIVYGDNIDDKYVTNEFTLVLKEMYLYDRCYITNAVKCSTIDNKVSISDLNTCYYEFLIKEIKIIKPKVIIALGNQVYDFLINKYKNVFKLKHPSWYYSYGCGTKEEQMKEINTLIGLIIRNEK